MTMKYEPMKTKKIQLNKQYKLKNENNEMRLGYEEGVKDSFDSFASYVDFYKRYKGNVKLLMNEHKSSWKEWVNYFETQTNIDKSNYAGRYNEWLFDYIFTDIDDASMSFLKL